MEKAENNFKPWRKGFIGGSTLIGAGLVLLLGATRTPPLSIPPLLASFACIGLGGLWVKSAFARWNGKNIEQKSINSLDLPEGWIVTPNYLIKGGGDIDLLIQSPDGQTFAVEIKSLQNVEVKPGFLMITRASLVRSDGKKLADDPIGQTLKNAEIVDATPVLWCPKAAKSGVHKVGRVVVVLGGKKRLSKALGIRRAPWSW